MKTQQEVAQILKDSELFNSGTKRSCGYMHCTLAKKGMFQEYNSTCMACDEFKEEPIFTMPTADQAERILAEMELQVDKEINGWWIGSINRFAKPISLGGFDEIGKGERTLANNAALSYLCQHKKEELAQAINSTKHG